MKELALLPGQRKHRDEGEQDDRHGEEDRPPNEPRGVAHGVPHGTSIARVDGALLDVAEGVLGDHDAGIDQHADGDGDARPGS